MPQILSIWSCRMLQLFWYSNQYYQIYYCPVCGKITLFRVCKGGKLGEQKVITSALPYKSIFHQFPDPHFDKRSLEEEHLQEVKLKHYIPKEMRKYFNL